MSEGGSGSGVEIYVSSGIPNESRSTVSSILRNQLNSESNKLASTAREIDLKKESPYKKAVELVESSLKTLYLSVGIELTDDRFDNIHLYELSPGQQPGGSAAVGGEVEARVVEGAGMLSSIETVHHELHHVAGRRIISINPNLNYYSCQIGLDTGMNLQRPLTNGQFLEEGAMEYFSFDYVLNSSDPFVAEARRAYAEDKGAQVLNMTDYEIREVCESELDKSSDITYAQARILVETLVEGARRIDDNEAMEMKKDILKTRVDTKNMRRLMDRVDKIFGQGTFSRIYHLKFKGEEDKNGLYIEQLRTKVGLRSLY